MPTDAWGNGDTTRLSPDEAFDVLGNDTRIDILRTLGEADEPLRFNEVRRTIGIDDPGRFNYHLDQLVGSFVEKTDRGYVLRQPGRRVVQAVYSGVVTEEPVVQPIQIDVPCSYCGAPIEVSYRQEMMEAFCTECQGAYGDKERELVAGTDSGHIGGLTIPPAGVDGRTPEELHSAAQTWGYLDMLSVASGVCPRCSARVTHSIDVCLDHDAAEGLCAECDRRHAVQTESKCTNCILERDRMFVIHLLPETEVQAFLTAHGVNFVTPESNPWRGFEVEEEILSTDPFEVRFTFIAGEDALAVTVEDDLEVVEATRS